MGFRLVHRRVFGMTVLERVYMTGESMLASGRTANGMVKEHLLFKMGHRMQEVHW